MPWKCHPIRSDCCAKSGGCSPPAAGCLSWCPIGAASGRAWIRRRSATAGPIRGRKSCSCCAKPGSRRPAGTKRFTCRRSRAAGSCAPPWRGSVPAPRWPRRSPASTSWKRPNRSIAPSRRHGARSGAWCRRSSRCWRRRPARRRCAERGRPWPWSCARIANVATVICRPRRRWRASARLNARSAPTASTTCCSTSARTAAAVLSRGRSARRPNGAPDYPSPSGRLRPSACRCPTATTTSRRTRSASGIFRPRSADAMRKFLKPAIGALALLGLAIVAADHSVWSQTGRTIRIVLGVPPGGSIDFLARLLADQISSTTGQTMIVESKPGAGGIIAAETVARAAPDGNTLLINNNGTLISAILRKVNYDPIASFEPICYLVTTPQIIVVNSASPYRTLAELLDAARQKPGELSIASVGPNTTQHIGIERLKRVAGANLTYVPYPGGATTINALLGEHITAAVLNWSEIGEHIVAGKARALATMAPQRIEPQPDLPTVAESGYRDFETDVWFGVVAPAKTPKETVAQLIDWFRTAVTAPQVKAKLVAQALYPNPKCGAEFDAHLRRQAASLTQLIHDLDFKAE